MIDDQSDYDNDDYMKTIVIRMMIMLIKLITIMVIMMILTRTMIYD